MNNNYLNGIVDRIEGEKAILSFSDGQKLNWPIEKLPPNCAESSPVRIMITAADELPEAGENELLAKDILNEILGTND